MLAHHKVTALVLLRLTLGWFFFYAGVTKILDPQWTAEGFLRSATTFKDFYAFFSAPELLPIVNVLNSWGLAMIGAALLLGVGMRIATHAGILLMVLYYFPHENKHSFVTDDHVIIALALYILYLFKAGESFSFAPMLSRLRIIESSELLKKIIH